MKGNLKTSKLSSRVAMAMGFFGSIQIVSILCSMVRTKLVALWIGAIGVGLFGLFNTALEMLSTFFQLGIRNSAVREVAIERNDPSRAARIIKVIRSWGLFLATIGAIITIVFSNVLSELTFGDSSYTFAFIILAIALFANIIMSGELAILQGMDRIKRLAKASVWGLVTGLVISIPMYYFWRENSIVPSILVFTCATLVAALIYRERTPSVKLSVREIRKDGTNFMELGFYITISLLLSQIASYIFMSWLNVNAKEGTEDVGYFQAGFTLVNKYIGLIFSAISLEFFPRLSSVYKSVRKSSLFVSHEIVMVMIVIMPVALLFLAFDRIVVEILYDKSFFACLPFIVWGLAGTVLRAFSWCMAFTIMARGDGKLFVVTETISSVFYLIFNIFAYQQWGIDGFGYAYAAWYLLYSLIIGFVYFRNYRMKLNKPAKIWTLTAFLTLTLFCFLKTVGVSNIYIIVAASLSVIVSFYALKKLVLKKKGAA